MQLEHYIAPSGERLVCRRESRAESYSPPDIPIIVEILHGFRAKSLYGRRKGDEFRLLLHWRDSKWLYVTLALLTLCILDAILTLQILSRGGTEVNVLMAMLLRTNVELFAWLKITLTAFGSVVLVAYSHLIIFRGFNVGHVLLLLLFAYSLLIVYECLILAEIFLF